MELCYHKKLSKFIIYLDINNLYGWEMIGYLPYGGFQWLQNIAGFDASSVSAKSPKGYIFEVDLQYPNELNVLHNNYALAQQKLAIPYDMLSDYCKKNCRRIWNKSW